MNNNWCQQSRKIIGVNTQLFSGIETEIHIMHPQQHSYQYRMHVAPPQSSMHSHNMSPNSPFHMQQLHGTSRMRLPHANHGYTHGVANFGAPLMNPAQHMPIHYMNHGAQSRPVNIYQQHSIQTATRTTTYSEAAANNFGDSFENNMTIAFNASESIASHSLTTEGVRAGNGEINPMNMHVGMQCFTQQTQQVITTNVIQTAETSNAQQPQQQQQTQYQCKPQQQQPQHQHHQQHQQQPQQPHQQQHHSSLQHYKQIQTQEYQQNNKYDLSVGLHLHNDKLASDNKTGTGIGGSSRKCGEQRSQAQTILGCPSKSGAGDGNDNASSELSQAKLTEITKIALFGSELAEQLAQAHRSRPCFKKIDSLCARMKQDLVRGDSVIPNINSQDEGMERITDALAEDFVPAFKNWQDSSIVFAQCLIKSFINLDELIIQQKSARKRDVPKPTGVAATSTPMKTNHNGGIGDQGLFAAINFASERLDDPNDKYSCTMVQNSEKTQRQAEVNGTYLVTGTYKPITKSATFEREEGFNVNDNIIANESEFGRANVFDECRPIHEIDEVDEVNDDSDGNGDADDDGDDVDVEVDEFYANPDIMALQGNSYCQHYFPDMNMEIPDYFVTAGMGTINNHIIKPLENEPHKSMQYDPNSMQHTDLQIQTKYNTLIDWNNSHLRKLEHNMRNFTLNFGGALTITKNIDFEDKLNVIVDRLMTMEHADMFFRSQFTYNYFPDFVEQCNASYLDIRSIILKCQTGDYDDLGHIIRDVKNIITAVRGYLQHHENSELQRAVTLFEDEVNIVLNAPPFDIYFFTCIIGEPEDTHYLCTGKY